MFGAMYVVWFLSSLRVLGTESDIVTDILLL